MRYTAWIEKCDSQREYNKQIDAAEKWSLKQYNLKNKFKDSALFSSLVRSYFGIKMNCTQTQINMVSIKKILQK